MKSAYKTALAVLVGAGVTVASSAAFADEPYNTIGCLHMSQKVADALAANQSSPNFKAASDENKAGHSYCQSGVYNVGIAHYSKALDLLGVSKS
jgi:hypothetical protein